MRLDRQRMDLPADALAERPVHQLVAGEATEPDKRWRDIQRGIVGVVIGAHLDLRAGDGAADKLGDLFGVHEWRPARRPPAACRPWRRECRERPATAVLRRTRDGALSCP